MPQWEYLHHTITEKGEQFKIIASLVRIEGGIYKSKTTISDMAVAQFKSNLIASSTDNAVTSATILRQNFLDRNLKETISFFMHDINHYLAKEPVSNKID